MQLNFEACVWFSGPHQSWLFYFCSLDLQYSCDEMT